MRESVEAQRTCDPLRYPDLLYNVTPAYDECMNASYIEYDRCYPYLDECSPARDEDCGNWIIDDRYVKKSAKWQACVDDVEKVQEACDRYLEQVDPATLVKWINPLTGREAGEGRRECTARFTIPLTNAPSTVFTGDVGLPTPAKSPVESVYCSIVELFGGKCE